MTSGPTNERRALVHPAIHRPLASAAVSAGLGLAFWLAFYIGSRSRFTGGGTCGGGTWGCLGLAIIGGLAGILAIVVVAWPLLHVAGVRPAWPVALVGPVIGIATYREVATLTGRSLVTGLWIVMAVSYAAAAVITAPRLYRYWSAVVAMAVVALDLATRFLSAR